MYDTTNKVYVIQDAIDYYRIFTHCFYPHRKLTIRILLVVHSLY
jgi:hypothetical protein